MRITSDVSLTRRVLSFGRLTGASLLAGSLLVGVALAQTEPPKANDEAARAAQAEAKARADWSKAMTQIPTPKNGCFTADFPQREWREVPCTTPPDKPYPPAIGHRPQIVGGSNDFAAEVGGTLIAAEGSFNSVTGVTSESGNVGGSAPAVANTYSLQLNTKPFTTSVCSPSPNPGCQGWQQFIFSNAGTAFIQYWLLRYNTTCPSSWNTFSFPSSTDIYCWRNGPNAVAVAAQPITSLASLRLGANAGAGGMDGVIMTTGAGTFSASNNGNMLNLAANWSGIEFIIVGDCCGSQANFNAGSTIVVRTTTHSGTTSAPNCVLEGFTGETNNLNLVGTPGVGTGPSPAVVSTQSNVAGGAAASCASASGVGDTHLATFGGLLYDFQATGDFVLAERGDFLVQTRQVSGAPTWPEASVNRAVAVRTGKQEVAICAQPTRVVIDGIPAKLGNGKVLELADGGDVIRRGNVYVVRGAEGDSIRAEVKQPGYINVSVGLGRWPAKVSGLLANAGRVTQIATRDGVVLTSPFAFEELYGRFGESWRVPAEESMLVPACGKAEEEGVPEKPFFAADLDRELARRTRAICAEAGIEGPLLEACVLDVAVIGRRNAAGVFKTMAKPVAVGALQ